MESYVAVVVHVSSLNMGILQCQSKPRSVVVWQVASASKNKFLAVPSFQTTSIQHLHKNY